MLGIGYEKALGPALNLPNRVDINVGRFKSLSLSLSLSLKLLGFSKCVEKGLGSDPSFRNSL